MMWVRSIKTLGIVMMAVFLSIALSGCGSSQELTELNSILVNYEHLVEDYSAVAGGTDQTKKSEIETQIKDLSATWAEKRNEFGSLITPQEMDKLAKKYDMLSKKLPKELIGTTS